MVVLSFHYGLCISQLHDFMNRLSPSWTEFKKSPVQSQTQLPLKKLIVLLLTQYISIVHTHTQAVGPNYTVYL